MTIRRHQPAHPPIDCPLRKAGIDPRRLRPFKDVKNYIAFLERKDRAAWQKPDAVIAALKLTGSETLADLGAGSGYFTFRFAAALPRGRVVAIDVEPEMVRHLHHKAMSNGIRNVQVVLATAKDPRIPRTADLVFVCDVLHHVKERQAWLRRLHTGIKVGARFVLIEFKEGKLPEGPPASVKVPKKTLVDLATKAGFRLIADRSELLPYQVFLEFSKRR